MCTPGEGRDSGLVLSQLMTDVLAHLLLLRLKYDEDGLPRQLHQVPQTLPEHETASNIEAHMFLNLLKCTDVL